MLPTALACSAAASRLEFVGVHRRHEHGCCSAPTCVRTSPAPGPAPLSEGARIVDTFIAPSKTFTDLRRNAQWWRPCLLISFLGWGLVYVSDRKIGVQTDGGNEIASAAQAEANTKSSLPSSEKRVKITGVIYYVAIPVTILLIWRSWRMQFATFKFGASADISFKTALAIVVYAGLPRS